MEEPLLDPQLPEESPAELEGSSEETAPTVSEEQEPQPLTYVIPESTAHWAQVRSFLSLVEEDNPPDIRQIVEEVQKRFPTYVSVQADVSRILASLN